MRPMSRRRVLGSSFGVAASLSSSHASASWADDSTQPARGGRQLAIAITEPEDADFEAAFARAVGVGMDRIPLSFLWKDLEPEPGRHSDLYPGIANLVFPAAGMPIDLALAPIATNQSIVPSDLEGRAWDDPAVIDRFLAWIDAVLVAMPDCDIRTVLLGIEVDGLLSDDRDEWVAYATLVERAAAFVRVRRPDTLIGVEIMLDGRNGYAADLVHLVDDLCDFIAVSHYWMDGLQVRDLADVPREFERLAHRYPDKPVHFVECGFPSSTLNGSSVELQAEWLRAIFRAWDDHATEIPVVTFVWQHDISPEAVAFYEDFYGLKDEAFAAYLGSIGLRTYEGAGRDKPAWPALAEEAASRGW